MTNESEQCREATRHIVDCDRESWVKARLRTLVNVAIAVVDRAQTRADEDISEHAIAGAINGAAVEIIHTLGMEPEYVNLWDRDHVYRGRSLGGVAMPPGPFRPHTRPKPTAQVDDRQIAHVAKEETDD